MLLNHNWKSYLVKEKHHQAKLNKGTISPNYNKIKLNFKISGKEPLNRRD